MTADFSTDGTWPDRKDWFMILVMRGETAEMFAFSSIEGKDSRAQVVGFIFLRTSSTSLCVVSVKEQRGWTFSNDG